MILRIEHVTKRYGAVKALDDLTFSVEAGAVGLLGPNGAGKSTLIKMLLGLVAMTEGRAHVFDLDVRTSARRIRELVGYMPEDDCIVPGLRGIEAVAYAGELAGIPPRTALRRAHEMLDYCFIGEERYREVQTYSTGMRQKIRLAQAIIHAPKLLFLDEPTSGLDPEGRERMLRLIRDLSTQRKMSVVVSTHILKDVELCCDSIVVLGHGRLLVQDDLAVLQRTVDPYVVARYRGDGEAFARELGVSKLETEAPADGMLRVSAPSDPDPSRQAEVPSLVFGAAKRAGVELLEVRRSRNSLEQVFLEAIRAAERPEADVATALASDDDIDFAGPSLGGERLDAGP